MTGFGPAAEILFFWEKDPKPLTPCLTTLDWMDARHGKARQLASLKQGPPIVKSVLPEGQTAGVREAFFLKIEILWVRLVEDIIGGENFQDMAIGVFKVSAAPSVICIKCPISF